MYIAKKAQSDYEELLSEARSGIPLNKESFYETEKIISTAVKNGQHIYHAIKANNLSVSMPTVYRHIKMGYYSISSIDLPRVVKFKPRRLKKSEYVPKCVKQGRTYSDYLENPSLPVVQLDTVIGKIGGKVIMTIHFTDSDFMIGILLEKNRSRSGRKNYASQKST